MFVFLTRFGAGEDLSEPYSVFTYRYFLMQWPQLCLLAMLDNDCVGTVVCKIDTNQDGSRRGYIAMLDVQKAFRKHGLGEHLWHYIFNIASNNYWNFFLRIFSIFSF